MAISIFGEYHVCHSDDCEMVHCALCGTHVFGPAWGTMICSTCCEAMQDAQDYGSLTPGDLERWNEAIGRG